MIPDNGLFAIYARFYESETPELVATWNERNGASCTCTLTLAEFECVLLAGHTILQRCTFINGRSWHFGPRHGQ
jgi:hypothetical protein